MRSRLASMPKRGRAHEGLRREDQNPTSSPMRAAMGG